MPKLIMVASAVIFGAGENHGRCLYQLRPDNVIRPNQWEYPGGKLKRGETAEEAIIRECREELGVEIAIHGNLGTFSVDLGDVFLITSFAARIVEGVPRPLASKKLQWAELQFAVDHMTCQYGVLHTYRAVRAWMERTA